MLPDTEDRVAQARTAPASDLNSWVHEIDERVLLALLENPNLTEAHVTALLERLDLPANVLDAIGGQGKWTAHESVRVHLAGHPHTPKRIALAVLRQLFLFDLVRICLLPSAPGDIRRLAEEAILVRVPHLPVGEKLTLARRGPSRVAGAILAEGQPQAIKIVLGNAFLTEAQVLRVLAKSGVPERVVAEIARHPKWSCQYNVRLALVRNEHTPLPLVMAFLPNLTLRDLKDISKLERLPPHLRAYIRKELARRTGTSGKPAW